MRYLQVKLMDGETHCPKCEGFKTLSNDRRSINIKGNRVKIQGDTLAQFCDECNGTGKLDWVEVITGKRIPIP